MAKAFLFYLSLLLLSSYTVFADEGESVIAQPPNHHASAPSPHHHGRQHHKHAHPPATAPAHSPSHPPATAPAHPPSHHHHHAHPPSHAPVHPPTPHPPSHAPVHPPTPQPPSHVPVHPPPPVHPHPLPRAFVAVQGVVYCKSCKYKGSDTLTGASPVLGASVKLQCNNSRYPQEVEAKTDKNGYFFLQAPKTVTNYGAHKCKVSLVSSPLPSCQKPSLLHGGATGAILRPEKPFTANKLPFFLYTVGPLAFEPKCY